MYADTHTPFIYFSLSSQPSTSYSDIKTLTRDRQTPMTLPIYSSLSPSLAHVVPLPSSHQIDSPCPPAITLDPSPLRLPQRLIHASTYAPDALIPRDILTENFAPASICPQRTDRVENVESIRQTSRRLRTYMYSVRFPSYRRGHAGELGVIPLFFTGIFVSEGCVEAERLSGLSLYLFTRVFFSLGAPGSRVNRVLQSWFRSSRECIRIN